MDLLAILRRSGGIDALARQAGLPPPIVATSVEASLPALLSGLRDYAQKMDGTDAGVSAMLAMIDGLGNGLLAAEIMGPGPLPLGAGDNVIAQFFGRTDAKRRLAAEVAAVSGEDAAVLERVLPLLAMLVCGYVSARAGADDTRQDTIVWLRDLLLLQDHDAPRGDLGAAG